VLVITLCTPTQYPGEPSTQDQMSKLIIECSAQKLPNSFVTFPEMKNQASDWKGDEILYLPSNHWRDLLATVVNFIRE
jgi:hypothetical protein